MVHCWLSIVDNPTIYDCYIDLAVISILAATQQGAIVNQY